VDRAEAGRIRAAGAASDVDPAELLAALGHAVIVTDPRGHVRHWNAAAERLYGWRADEALGRNIRDLTVVKATLDTAEDIMAALAQNVAWSGAFPVRRKDGSVFQALVTDTGLFEGDELVGIVGVSVNLGVALRPLLERAWDAAVVLTPTGVITYTSPAATKVFGWSESLVGQSVVPLVHPDDREALADFVDQVVREPGPHPALEMRVRAGGDGWVLAEVAVTNLLDDPDVRGLVCNLRKSRSTEARESAERQVDQLNFALRSRSVVEQAKGYLAARYGVTVDNAFEAIRAYARNHQQKVHDVAEQILAEELDPLRPAPGRR
jgi:PAS domain S-box-containing protein